MSDNVVNSYVESGWVTVTRRMPVGEVERVMTDSCSFSEKGHEELEAFIDTLTAEYFKSKFNKDEVECILGPHLGDDMNTYDYATATDKQWREGAKWYIYDDFEMVFTYFIEQLGIETDVEVEYMFEEGKEDPYLATDGESSRL